VAESLIENVSDTAFWVAYHRGREGARQDALFRDPLAARLAGERGRAIAQDMPNANFTAWMIAMRTSIIDDYIRRAIAAGADTVVNLGAGLDTRPYRMELPPELAWVEVDYPAVIDFKTQQLSGETPRCGLQRIKLDLADAPARRAMLATLDARAKGMLVITEGVVPYLNTTAVAALADELRALDHVCQWIVDYLSPESMKYRKRHMARRMQNAPFQFEPDDWFAFFAAHGWSCKEMRYLADEAARVRRPLPLPVWAKVLWGLRGLFASKRRREAFRTLAGYATLEPLPG
jgi:methyltransferase (TIGR00027 family)